MIAIIEKLLAPVQRRVKLMVCRAVINLVDDSLKMQIVQVSLLANSDRDGIERFQNYGHTSHPHPGAEGVAVSIGGNQDHCIVIAVDDRRYRLTGLAEGEVALHDDLGQKVYLTRNGIVIDGAGLPINIQNTPHVTATTALFTITGDLAVQGNITAGVNITAIGTVAGALIASGGNVTAYGGSASMSNMKLVYNGHTHTDPQGGSVGAPSALMP